MNAQPKLTLEKLAELKCARCDGSGILTHGTQSYPNAHCPECHVDGSAFVVHDRDVLAFLAREIMKTNKRLDETTKDNP